MKTFITKKETTKEVTTREIYCSSCWSLTDIFIHVARRGYRIVGFEIPKQGQWFLSSDFTILTANEDFKYDPYLILEIIPTNLKSLARVVVRTETSVKDVYGDINTNQLKNFLVGYRMKIVGFRCPVKGEKYIGDYYNIVTALANHIEGEDNPKLILAPIADEIDKSIDEFLY